jgi:hypothetical protein
MNAFLAKILVTILTSAPSLVTEIEAEFTAIAHGEGGVQKVTNALQGLMTIIETATGIAAAAPPKS